MIRWLLIVPLAFMAVAATVYIAVTGKACMTRRDWVEFLIAVAVGLASWLALAALA